MSKPTPIPPIDETIVRDIAAGDQSVAIHVPAGKNGSYLRLGDHPDDERDWDSGTIDDVFTGSPDVDAMSRGFIHGKNKGYASLDALAREGGWVDGTAGNRVSLTGKNKVEIIHGDYKLITCKGQAGIDFSGGHLRMWSKTPGTLTKVLDDHDAGATEAVNASKRYSLRVSCGEGYDESWMVGSFEAYFGKGSPHDSVGEPPGEIAVETDCRLTEYREEIYAKEINEIFNTTEAHTEVVDATTYSEKRLVKKLLHTEEDAQDILHETKATLTIEDKVHVGYAKVDRRMDPQSLEEETKVGGSSMKESFGFSRISEEYKGVSYFQTIDTDLYRQEYSGWGTYMDLCMAKIRNEALVGDIFSRQAYFAASMMTDASLIRTDVILSPLWIEAHGAVKVESRAGVVVNSGKLETVNRLVDVSVQSLKVIL